MSSTLIKHFPEELIREIFAHSMPDGEPKISTSIPFDRTKTLKQLEHAQDAAWILRAVCRRWHYIIRTMCTARLVYPSKRVYPVFMDLTSSVTIWWMDFREDRSNHQALCPGQRPARLPIVPSQLLYLRTLRLEIGARAADISTFFAVSPPTNQVILPFLTHLNLTFIRRNSSFLRTWNLPRLASLTFAEEDHPQRDWFLSPSQQLLDFVQRHATTIQAIEVSTRRAYILFGSVWTRLGRLKRLHLSLWDLCLLLLGIGLETDPLPTMQQPAIIIDTRDLFFCLELTCSFLCERVHILNQLNLRLDHLWSTVAIERKRRRRPTAASREWDCFKAFQNSGWLLKDLDGKELGDASANCLWDVLAKEIAEGKHGTENIWPTLNLRIMY